MECSERYFPMETNSLGLKFKPISHIPGIVSNKPEMLSEITAELEARQVKSLRASPEK